MIELHNDRGFLRGEFVDCCGEKCSIQESSMATEPCIWLGCEHETVDEVSGQKCGARMHLTRELVAALLPHLQRFAEYGSL
jgi:hypothetical protein